MTTSYQTTPYQTPSDIHPCLVYQDAPAAIDWLCRAFGFTRQFVVLADDGSVAHSELSLGSGVVMVGSPKPGEPTSGTSTLSVYVPDPDAHHACAVAAGAQITRPLRDEDHGSRGYMAEDPEGHAWYFGNYRPGGYWENPPA